MKIPVRRSSLGLSLGCALMALASVGAVLANGAAAGKPADLNDVTGTRGLLMVDKLGSRVRFFNPDTNQEISNLDVGAKPHEFAVSPDHKTAYVSVYGDGVYGNNPHPNHVIAIIDLASRKEVGTIDVSPNVAPHGIMVDAKGTLYVTCDISRKLLIIDPKKRKIKASIDTEGTGHWVTILPNGSKAYVANKTDKPFITVIDLKARKVIGHIPAPNDMQGISASPDGGTVLAVSFHKPEMMVIDSATDQVTSVVPLQGLTQGAFRVRYSPDGKWVVVTAERDNAAIIFHADNLQGPQQLVPVGKTPMGVAFTADCRKVLVANHGEGTISIINLAEGRALDRFPAGTGVETLAYY